MVCRAPLQRGAFLGRAPREDSNRALTIIGWDDGYSASNFPEGEYADPQTGKTVTRVRPPGDGAWLAKNSWGAGTNEFPDRGTGRWGIPVQKTDEDGNPVLDENGDPVMVGSGFFWLSYYDQSISNPEVLIFGKTLSSTDMFYSFEPNELIRDQYDFMPVTSLTAREPSPAPEPVPGPVDNSIAGGSDVGGNAWVGMHATMPKTGDDGAVVHFLMVLSALGLAVMLLAYRNGVKPLRDLRR